ncbi:hypothetical protein NP233_g2897 [Leucocoprinus birnbaumii]|uniref:Glycoside hydrolase family 92 protein n=1 Tax=Leucocoprinus birnbaumii TaxID=56174 RepID=A0AAD5YYD9_9AGAR|nr:hypothetical protein NP233_g2897 [Leucocoprinus birnbaumii]
MASTLVLVLTTLLHLAVARPASYAVWAADSAIARSQGNGLDSSGQPSVSYEHGELQWGLRQLYERTGNQSYFNYIVAGANNIVYSNGTVHGGYTYVFVFLATEASDPLNSFSLTDYSLDPVRTGPTFLYLYQQTGQSKWKTAADTFRKQLQAHPRTAQGQFWHKKRYFNQGWLDGIYMGDVFYAQYTKDFQPTNSTAWADIATQFNLMYQNSIQASGDSHNIGLLYHGYDYSHTAVWASADRGHSPEVWDRALGWYAMALVDTLEIIPASEPGHATLLNILRTIAPKIRDSADASSGVWWLVMTQAGRTGNYFESSGSAMFVYALLKGVRLGYISDSDGSIVKAAKKAFQYMTSHWVISNSDGTMGWINTVQVGSLNGNGTFEYYISVPTVLNDLKGLAAFLLASLEYEKLIFELHSLNMRIGNPSALTIRCGLFILLGIAEVQAATNLTSLVNLFIGTASGANGGSGGNVFPGAAIPHGMAKVGIDVSTAPRQAGYIHDNSSITGISLLHDEGTGGNTNGGYGVFPLFPLINCNFTSCPVGLSARQALRAAGTDVASPGYFTTTFVNGIKLETTSTRRAGLIRFTFPASSTSRHVVVDLANDLQRSFHGGEMNITRNGRVQLQGTYLQSYGLDNCTAFACYDFVRSGASSPIVTYGTYKSVSTSSPTNITITPISNSATGTLNFPFTNNTNPTQAGALIQFNTGVVTARFGVSMISSAQACANAESEIGNNWDFDGIRETSRSMWESILERVVVDTEKEDPTVVQLLYSSLYRISLVPANFTGENPYWKGNEPFFDALFCSWDTFRTVHPFLSLIAPREWADIVRSYIDGWRNTGYIPECRSNTKNGFVQGGSDGMPILGDFAVKYSEFASELGVSVDDLYQALVDTAENTPPDWYRVGRENTGWKTFGYIPTAWVDPSGATGLATREASRAFEYALGDFAVRQAGVTLHKSADDAVKYTNRSMNFVNMWDASLVFDGFQGYAQRRFPNGSFAFSSPDACSPIDPVGHSCARGDDNNVGFYESSSWEMSFFAPQSMSTIVRLMGGEETFIQRVDHYFSKGYFQAGNEPSFAVPWAYHYANRPDLTALRVRGIVYKNFNTGIGGIPGNDDSGAMAALLAFHLLGLYPVPSTTQLLIGSPFLSSYTLTNTISPSQTFKTTVRVVNFDSRTLVQAPANGTNLYVQSVTVDGVRSKSRCWIDFWTLLRSKEVVIEVGQDPGVEVGCGTEDGAVPASLEAGGFGEPIPARVNPPNAQ